MKQYEDTIIINDIAHLLSKKELTFKLDNNTWFTLHFKDEREQNENKKTD